MTAGDRRTNEEWVSWIGRGGGVLNGEEAHAVVAELLFLREQLGVSFDCSRPPPVIYHYCSSESFESIVRSKEIWLADSSVSNDAMENELPLKAIERVVLETLEASEGEITLEMFKTIRRSPFIACFSELDDSLGQWRAYAGDGTGFALGIAPHLLDCHIGPRGLTWQQSAPDRISISREVTLVQMIYDLSVFEGTVRRACAEQYKAMREAKDRSTKANWRGGLLSHLHTFSMLAKHNGFREEREWRLLHREDIQLSPGRDVADADPGVVVQRSLPERVRFLGGVKRNFVPFKLGLPAGQSPIVEVVTGPNNRIGDDDLRRLLVSEGLDGVNIRRSEIPYRR
ncbi:MAG TPA: DUF2971 domain-containing protein [Planctomycetota bacterium]|jgi:hypothetical protein|nr:DUF2971 domain-containing protein [Planctomycetota bacterium]